MKEGGESDSNNDSNPSFSTIGFLSTNLNDESQIRDDLTLIDNVGFVLLSHSGSASSVYSLQSTSHHSASRRRQLLLLRRFPEAPRFRGNGVRINRSLLNPPQTRTRISPFPYSSRQGDRSNPLATLQTRSFRSRPAETPGGFDALSAEAGQRLQGIDLRLQRYVLQGIAIAGSRSLCRLRSCRWRRTHCKRSHSRAAARAIDERRDAAASLGAKRARNHVSAQFDLVEEQSRGLFPHQTRAFVHEQHLQSPRKRGNVATLRNSIRITCRKNPVLAGTGKNRGNGSGFERCGIRTSEFAASAQRNTIPQ